jgi:hypothetical protein
MTIEVTQEDIDKGERFLGLFCPIARAAKRTMGLSYQDEDIYNCHVGSHDMRLKGEFVKLPNRAMEFIFNFDKKREVSPFSFDVFPMWELYPHDD